MTMDLPMSITTFEELFAKYAQQRAYKSSGTIVSFPTNSITIYLLFFYSTKTFP